MGDPRKDLYKLSRSKWILDLIGGFDLNAIGQIFFRFEYLYRVIKQFPEFAGDLQARLILRDLHRAVQLDAIEPVFNREAVDLDGFLFILENFDRAHRPIPKIRKRSRIS
jgi:hypothetical protein